MSDNDVMERYEALTGDLERVRRDHDRRQAAYEAAQRQFEDGMAEARKAFPEEKLETVEDLEALRDRLAKDLETAIEKAEETVKEYDRAVEQFDGDQRRVEASDQSSVELDPDD